MLSLRVQELYWIQGNNSSAGVRPFIYLFFFGTHAVSTRCPEKNPFVGLWLSARCGRLCSREVWASTSFRSSSRQRLHWTGTDITCAVCSGLCASVTVGVQTSAISTLARTHCQTTSHAHSGIVNSLCCPTFCESVRLLADSPSGDICIKLLNLCVCVSLG